MNHSLLEVHDLAISTPTGRVLAKNISFALHSGECLLVAGPNGVGKSTLLNVLVQGRGQSKGKLHRATERIAWIPQIQNIGCHLPLRLQDILDMAGTKREWQKVLEQTHLLSQNRLDAPWDTASGGERQRTLLARALVHDPEILFLDEPFNHLDTDGKRLVQNVLREFLADKTKSIIVVSHQMEPITHLNVPVKTLVLSETTV